MMAAITASKDNQVILLDKNEKLGKKLFITGKGRCNVTNSKDISEFFEYIPGNPFFLYSALYTYDNNKVIDFFESQGVKLKSERGGRVFPKSNKSSDIIKGLQLALKNNNINVMLNSNVIKINARDNKILSVELSNGKIIKGDYFIFATGGASYPLTGSTGDGQKFAKKLGHNIIDLKPSLVPIELCGNEFKDLMGLSLKNVKLSIKSKNKKVYEDLGEMIFTHFGVSGPLVLSGSRFVSKDAKFELTIDLKPALEEKDLDLRIQKDFKKYINKEFKNSLNDLLPQKIIPLIIKRAGIEPTKKVNEITKLERRKLVDALKNLTFDICGLRPLEEAIVTAGGVDTKEIDPSTMKSKLISNLSIAGELIDVDAFTGGYNVQIALSTGYLAGSNI